MLVQTRQDQAKNGRVSVNHNAGLNQQEQQMSPL